MTKSEITKQWDECGKAFGEWLDAEAQYFRSRFIRGSCEKVMSDITYNADGAVSVSWLMTWQPITTAPRDGTRILAYYPNFGISLIHRHDPGGRYETWVRDDNAPLPGFVPSHWMPLPPQPDSL